MVKRITCLLVLLGLLATLPVLAFDFHHWRTDGVQVNGSSVGQQSSNQAFNIFDTLTDAGSGSYSLYWMGELQHNGGNSFLPPDNVWGDVPPTLALRDNRPQEPEVDWTTWKVVTDKTLPIAPPQPPRPAFTPNVPQAWGPVAVDLDTGFGSPDAFLVAVSFEPPTVGGVNDFRDQILTAYYPQNEAGLPGNDPSSPSTTRGTVRPFWIRNNDPLLPGLRIRDLEPVRGSLNNTNPGVGVVTHPPIFARVPATYRDSGGNVISEVLPVVFLVVGTGENGDFAKVICITLKKPGSRPATTVAEQKWLPEPAVVSASPGPAQPIEPPDPDFFNPMGFDPNNAAHGAVMWSYTVRVRGGSNLPVPVAGISFANVGTARSSRPLLFLTTADGQLICLNAKAADIATFDSDGDSRIFPVDDPEEEWKFATPTVTPTSGPMMGMSFDPGFHYGMSPAVARVPLTRLFRAGPSDPSAQTVNNALNNWNVSEWMVFVADTYGVFRAFEAPGAPRLNAMMQLIGRNPLARWTDSAGTPPGSSFRLDAQGNPERFITPPVVYQGNTPLTNASGALVNGSADIGFDDEVIFASERGAIYYLDAIGELMVGGGANDGRPAGNTFTRYRFPADDTPNVPAAPAVEPRNWPRQLPDPTVAVPPNPPANDPDLIDNMLGPAVPYDGRYFSRAPLAVALGANTNPQGSNPNLDIGDDVVFVPYMQTQNPGMGMGMGGMRRLYEYVGSMKPYGFIQASRPILRLTRARVTIGMNTVDIPLNRLRVGTVKSNALPVSRVPTTLAPGAGAGGANPNFDPGGLTPDDTVYFTAVNWWDDASSQYYQIPIGAMVTLEYDAPTSPSNQAAQQVTETLEYPSCYREVALNPLDPTQTVILRGRASLTEAHNRLQQRVVARDPNNPNVVNVTDEARALVPQGLFNNFDLRQPAMMAAGSANSGGLLMVPSFYRGRILAYTHRLRPLRTVLGCFDPRLDPNIRMLFNVGPPAPNFGPPGRDFTYDPGAFFQGFLADEPLCTDVGGSVTLVDGWTYVTYRNGHMRAYANVGGGAPGTIFGNPPIFQGVPGPPTPGNLVRAPAVDPNDPNGPRGIHITTDPTNPTNTAAYLDNTLTLDETVMLEWGKTIHVVVDFGPANEVAPPQTVDPNRPPTIGGGNDDIDGQVLQNEVQAQIRSSNGAVQQLPGVNRGVRPTVQNGRVIAVVPVFCGVPSPTNPLTPGTPVLWEKASAAFTGEVTFDLQVTQQGVRWRWPPYTPDPMNMGQYLPDPNKEHFWEIERNQGTTRFPTTAGRTGGNPNWSWSSEWAPLMTYNNPIIVGYDPDPASNTVSGIFGPAGPVQAVGLVNYTRLHQPGRKNGDAYIQDSVDGARSGSGQPIVPYVGMAIRGTGPQALAQQALFAEHGKTTPVSTTLLPDVGKLRVGDRSLLGSIGRPLTLRVQTAPLTKMGVGARFGWQTQNDNSLQNLGPHAGSFEQNVNSPDDGPDGLYSSIPAARVLVTKLGTNLDLSQGPVPVAGRDPNGGLPLFTQLEQLAVQVDVPAFTPDDCYSTRWRSSLPAGAPPASAYNPYYPGTLFGLAGRPVRDRAERLSRPGPPTQPPAIPPGEDPGPAAGIDPLSPDYDDRLRRIVIFNDANNNGLLDLLPTYREAYRTFGVQVVVKPDMKVEAAQQTLDFGAPWHGKKQPGMGAGALEIREWQRMAQLAQSASATDRSLAQFYLQYWRPLNLVNTGNVNLAYVKPELAYQIAGAGGPRLIGLPSEGNDPWRALSLVAGFTPAAMGGPNPLTDPFQIFLRTSFDDQLLPDQSAAYGAAGRGIWLQKAPPGAAQGGSVAYVDNRAVPSGNAINRDPTNGGVPRETHFTLNLPTGAALGQYAGSLRFYNDRSVAFAEDPTTQVGYRYARPANTGALNGTLERDPAPASLGEPLEPATDPPVRIKARVIENMVHGRVVNSASATQDPDRRIMPAAVADASSLSASGTVQRIVLAYISNRLGMGSNQPAVYDLFATHLLFDPGRLLFPFDELPRDRAPWADLANTGFGWTGYTTSPQGTQASRPSLVQDPNGVGVMAWTERRSVGQGDDQYRVWYQAMTANPAPILLQPGGQTPDVRVPRASARIVPQPGGPNWFAFYTLGLGQRRNLVYSFTQNLASGTSWSAEYPLGTSKGLATVSDPYAVTTPALARAPAALPAQAGQPAYLLAENATLPPAAWVAYTGSHPSLGRTDVYLSRYRIPAMLAAGTRTSPNQLALEEDFGQIGFPRVEGEVLQPNPERTRYVTGGTDLLAFPYSPVQVYMGRPEIPAGQAGSLTNPIRLIDVGQQATQTTNGELVFPLAAAIRSLAGLQNHRVIVDRPAGVIRLTLDARTLARIALPNPALTSQSADPVLTADYTSAGKRITRGSVASYDPVVVPVISQPAQPPVMDASWYRQQIDGAKWVSGTPVAGQADRLWVFWRRPAGAGASGPTCFYKVLRPGFRVRVGAIYGIRPSELSVTVNGQSVVAEEVNPQTGQLYFPATFEGQPAAVSYLGAAGQRITENHVITWLDESGERQVPMDTSVNEGSLDAFVSYEDVGMTSLGSATVASFRHMERIWMFWSSSRGSGGDLFYATLAPRLGPEANVGGSVTLFSISSPSRLGAVAPNRARQLLAQAAAQERRLPHLVPPIYRRGPYVPRATGNRQPVRSR